MWNYRSLSFSQMGRLSLSLLFGDDDAHDSTLYDVDQPAGGTLLTTLFCRFENASSRICIWRRGHPWRRCRHLGRGVTTTSSRRPHYTALEADSAAAAEDGSYHNMATLSMAPQDAIRVDGSG